MTTIKTIITWAGQVILFGGFLFFGIPKFFTPLDQTVFASFGSSIGPLFQYVTGAWEVVAAILTIIPATAAIGAALIALAMLAAILLHFVAIDPSMLSFAGVAAVFLVISLVVVYLRKSSLWFWK